MLRKKGSNAVHAPLRFSRRSFRIAGASRMDDRGEGRAKDRGVFPLRAGPRRKFAEFFFFVSFSLTGLNPPPPPPPPRPEVGIRFLRWARIHYMYVHAYSVHA